MSFRRGSIFTGSLLIAGTSIGAGMLALPFVTGIAGFAPSLVVSTLAWIYMLFTGLLFLEVTLWMPDGSNVLSMSRRFLGPIGWVIGGTAFVFLYYCLLVAYFSGGVPLFVEGVNQIFNTHLTVGIAFPICIIVLGAIIYFGASATGRINALLMAGMVISYIALLGMGASEVKGELLIGGNWPRAWIAAPTLFSAYGFHNIVPSVSTYLRRDVRKLRWAVIIGTLIPFVVYITWQWLMIGTIPQPLIAATLAAGESITHPLQLLLQNRWIAVAARYFSIFAITTSILGVAFSMVDFLGDGTKIPREGWGRLTLTLMVFIPPFIFAWLVPGLFFKALHYAGGFGEATLNGLIPALMVWVGRYRDQLKPAFWLPLGRVTLAITIVIALVIIVAEAIQLAGLLH